MLKAPQIDSFRHWFHDGNARFDEKSNELIFKFFDEIHKIKPCGSDERREIWVTAERGTIKDYYDYDTMMEYGEVESREEFVKMYNSDYPDDIYWYNLTTVEHGDYKGVFFKNRLLFQLNAPGQNNSWEYDISDFLEWLIFAVKEVIIKMQNNTYNDYVNNNLPPQHRIGTIKRKDYWNIFPEIRKFYFKDITSDEVQKFLKYISKQKSKENEYVSSLTANDFYNICYLGYKANKYDNVDTLLPKEAYYKYADGRDDGLKKIEPNSSVDFKIWLHNRDFGGHPWEVCRGGNSTHISLYVHEECNKYYLTLAGDAWNRSIETIKFFNALKDNGVPVYLRNGDLLAARVQEKDKIGIVPEGIWPDYCDSYFPNENLLDYINLPDENRIQVANKTKWQPIEKQFLL